MLYSLGFIVFHYRFYWIDCPRVVRKSRTPPSFLSSLLLASSFILREMKKKRGLSKCPKVVGSRFPV